MAIYIISSSAYESKEYAKRNNISNYRHIHDVTTIMGIRGGTLIVTGTYYRVSGIDDILRRANGCGMEIIYKEVK